MLPDRFHLIPGFSGTLASQVCVSAGPDDASDRQNHESVMKYNILAFVRQISACFFRTVLVW